MRIQALNIILAYLQTSHGRDTRASGQGITRLWRRQDAVVAVAAGVARAAVQGRAVVEFREAMARDLAVVDVRLTTTRRGLAVLGAAGVAVTLLTEVSHRLCQLAGRTLQAVVVAAVVTAAVLAVVAVGLVVVVVRRRHQWLLSNSATLVLVATPRRVRLVT